MNLKYFLIVFAAVIVLAVGIAYFLWPSSPSPSSSTNPASTTNPFGQPAGSVTGTTQNLSTPDGFAIAFYTWYITNREAQNSNFPPDDPASVFAPWLTPQFIANWQTMGDTMDADPVLWAQDDPSTWGPGITATVLNQSATASSVQVLVGNGTTQHTYTVVLVKTNGAWLINSVSGTY